MIKIAFGISTAAVLMAGLAVPAAPALAQQRTAELIVYGNDPCPRSTDDAIVVCARKPEAERYRIPEPYRPIGSRQERQAWGARAQSIEMVGRTGINSCSPVGPGGHTGCLEQMIDQAKAEAREATLDSTPPQ